MYWMSSCLLGEEIGSGPQNQLEDWWKQIDEWKAKKCLDFDRTSGVIKPQQVMEVVYRITKRPSVCGIGCRPTPNVCRITLSV